jgi:hypothetical protein
MGKVSVPALDMSVDAQVSGGVGSTALGTACSQFRAARKLKRQLPASVEDPESLMSEDSEDGAIRPQKRAALGTACDPRVARKPSRKLERQPPAGSIVRRHHKHQVEEIYLRRQTTIV